MKITEVKTFLVNARRQNWLFVKVMTDEGIYGWGEAMDTGGGIYGNKIDIWLPTSAACYQWGVRKVTIKVKQ